MWEQYKSIHKQFAKVKPEKREQFEQRHSRELILYDAAVRYLKDLKDSGEGMILSILVYTFFSRMFDLMLPPVAKHSIVVA